MSVCHIFRISISRSGERVINTVFVLFIKLVIKCSIKQMKKYILFYNDDEKNTFKVRSPCDQGAKMKEIYSTCIFSFYKIS